MLLLLLLYGGGGEEDSISPSSMMALDFFNVLGKVQVGFGVVLGGEVGPQEH
jgi:hypothetical protein